jgi:hypothetical protein
MRTRQAIGLIVAIVTVCQHGAVVPFGIAAKI